MTPFWYRNSAAILSLPPLRARLYLSKHLVGASNSSSRSSRSINEERDWVLIEALASKAYRAATSNAVTEGPRTRTYIVRSTLEADLFANGELISSQKRRRRRPMSTNNVSNKLVNRAPTSPYLLGSMMHVDLSSSRELNYDRLQTSSNKLVEGRWTPPNQLNMVDLHANNEVTSKLQWTKQIRSSMPTTTVDRARAPFSLVRQVIQVRQTMDTDLFRISPSLLTKSRQFTTTQIKLVEGSRIPMNLSRTLRQIMDPDLGVVVRATVIERNGTPDAQEVQQKTEKSLNDEAKTPQAKAGTSVTSFSDRTVSSSSSFSQRLPTIQVTESTTSATAIPPKSTQTHITENKTQPSSENNLQVILDPASPLTEVRLAVVEEALKTLPSPWRDTVVVPRHPMHIPNPRNGHLSNVRHIVAVASGKGGVGKSTVAVNLASALARLGARTGVFDADVHGPSLPTMLVPKNGGTWKVSKRGDEVDPVEVLLPVQDENRARGLPSQVVIKAMSFGFVGPGTGGRGERSPQSEDWQLGRGPSAAMMRGPVASRTAEELVSCTNWGDLDVLVVDLPPGTGDVHLAICQRLSIDAAVVVTTPQELAFVDVARGIDMLEALKVPVVALVENMAWFTCGNCSTRHRPFGMGHLNRLAKVYGVPNVFSLPMHQTVSEAGDSGVPFMLRSPIQPFMLANDDAIATKTEFENLARSVAHDLVVSAVFKTSLRPKVSYDSTSKLLTLQRSTPTAASMISLPAIELRRRLRAVDDMLGLQPANQDCEPVKIEPKGNYAVAITWSDGHATSIYTFDAIEEAAQAFHGGSSGG